MAEGNPGVTLDTLHDDLTAGFAGLKAEMRTFIKGRGNGEPTT